MYLGTIPKQYIDQQEIVVFFLVFVFSLWDNDSSISDKLFYVSYPFLYIYVFSGSILFFCLVCMASEMFTIITKRVDALDQQTIIKNGCYMNWNSSIDIWKHQHCTISQLVGNINSFCGSQLLLIIAFCFILTINSSFSILKFVRTGNSSVGVMLNLFGLAIGFYCFALLIYIPHSMRESVRQKRKCLLLPFRIGCIS